MYVFRIAYVAITKAECCAVQKWQVFWTVLCVHTISYNCTAVRKILLEHFCPILWCGLDLCNDIKPHGEPVIIEHRSAPVHSGRDWTFNWQGKYPVGSYPGGSLAARLQVEPNTSLLCKSTLVQTWQLVLVGSGTGKETLVCTAGQMWAK